MAHPGESSHRKLRITSVVAATAISLACGTNVCTVSTLLAFADTNYSMRTQHGHLSMGTSNAIFNSRLTRLDLLRSCSSLLLSLMSLYVHP